MTGVVLTIFFCPSYSWYSQSSIKMKFRFKSIIREVFTGKISVIGESRGRRAVNGQLSGEKWLSGGFEIEVLKLNFDLSEILNGNPTCFIMNN